MFLSVLLLFIISIIFLLFIYWVNINKTGIKLAPLFVVISLIISIVCFYKNSYFKLLNQASYVMHDTQLINNVDLKEMTKKNIKMTLNLHDNKNELYVLVIGESTNRDYMGLYNKFFDTTPRLEALQETLGENKFILVKNAYASFVNTLQALSYSLTPTTTDENPYSDFKKFDYKHNLITELNKQGVKTYWISNQANIGVNETFISAIANQCDHQYFAQEFDYQGAKPDWSALVGYLESKFNSIVNEKGKKLVIIHLMGSHGRYEERYPSSFEKYCFNSYADLGKLYQNSKKLNALNSYLNSINYGDFTITNIYNFFSQRDDFMGLFYFSDHADDPVIRSHNIDPFAETMAHIPAFFIFSARYEELYPRNIENLKANKDLYWINDNVFETVIDMLNVKVSYLQKSRKYSLFSHKNNYLASRSNTYCLGRNIKNDGVFLIDKYNKTSSRAFYAHRVNSLFKLNELINQNVRNFELDIVYDANNGGLLVNHNIIDDMDMLLPFSDFLYHAGGYIDNIWLDIKNLNKDNVNNILSELEFLNSTFKIKKKALIESQSYDLLNIFYSKGWDTSMYLYPDEEDFDGYFNMISKVINNNRVQNISYSSGYYEIVQEKLIPKLTRDVKQLTWDLNIEYKDSNLFEKIEKYQNVDEFIFPLITHFEH